MHTLTIVSLFLIPLTSSSPLAAPKPATRTTLHRRNYDCDHKDSEHLCDASAKTITPHNADACNAVIKAGWTSKIVVPDHDRPFFPCPPEHPLDVAGGQTQPEASGPSHSPLPDAQHLATTSTTTQAKSEKVETQGGSACKHMGAFEGEIHGKDDAGMATSIELNLCLDSLVAQS